MRFWSATLLPKNLQTWDIGVEYDKNCLRFCRYQCIKYLYKSFTFTRPLKIEPRVVTKISKKKLNIVSISVSGICVHLQWQELISTCACGYHVLSKELWKAQGTCVSDDMSSLPAWAGHPAIHHQVGHQKSLKSRTPEPHNYQSLY